MIEEFPGMLLSEWHISEAYALRDAAIETTDPEAYETFRNGALIAGMQAVKDRFIESLQELHPNVTFPPFGEDETMLEYAQRLPETINNKETDNE